VILSPEALALQTAGPFSTNDLLGLLVAGTTDYAIFMLDTGGNVATWNAGAQRFKGYHADEIVGRHFSVFYSPEDVAAGKPERELAIAAAEGHVQDEGWRVRHDGTRFWANVVITALRDSTGTLRGYGKITRDVTERRNFQGNLQHMADHDPLTGLLNRRSFERELASHAARVARYGALGAVLMIDLDNFKSFNDKLGHLAGDRLIVRVAKALQSRLRSSDVLARVGGDEFAVLLPDQDDAATEIVALALLQVVREEPSPVHAPHKLGASVGIARFEDGEMLTPEHVMAHADYAMYAAKSAGRNRWVRYGVAPQGHLDIA
jgi:diguanylate cyclase (GGDEF)-like protein/PAS domain S-box-containing protein